MAYLKFIKLSKEAAFYQQWEVKNRKGHKLGKIEWDKKYYVFVPHFELVRASQFYEPVFSHECLDEISKFLKQIP